MCRKFPGNGGKFRNSKNHMKFQKIYMKFQERPLGRGASRLSDESSPDADIAPPSLTPLSQSSSGSGASS